MLQKLHRCAKHCSPVQTIVLLFSTWAMASCSGNQQELGSAGNNKIVIYQVFTRLFGNTNTTNKQWGTLEENGVGKFADFTDTALDSIRALGVTHIWYTGIPHHALINDYSSIGISNDDPDVVKGRAGSPYAVKDYYNVNPDLATDPAKRLAEFEALVQRTHSHGLKVMIDIVPNHVARRYESLAFPDSVLPFGKNDDTRLAYQRDNDFYYIPGEPFRVPQPRDNYAPLGGETHPLADGKFDENPAKWTGNGSRLAQPDFNDWYETVKINYGIRPDGTKDFDSLPAGFDTAGIASHYNFWSTKKVPGSWKKFRDIALFWLDKGVDGFRFDMAEMVPVEFWSYMNSAIKHANPNAIVVAEVYNPAEYRNYIHKGKMDYLYDKVALYDTLKHIIQGTGSTDNLQSILDNLADIEHHMLHFLENHDEQRIASPEFAGNPLFALPAMVVSATVGTSPTLVYFGQEVGEPGADDAGFGQPSRTSIFDYVGVPNHQKWMNNGKFDGGQLSTPQKQLRRYYQNLLNLTISHPAFDGDYLPIHAYNRQNSPGYSDKIFSYLRQKDGKKVIVAVNFSRQQQFTGKLLLPKAVTAQLNMANGTFPVEDLLTNRRLNMVVFDGEAGLEINLPPLGSMILEIRD